MTPDNVNFHKVHEVEIGTAILKSLEGENPLYVIITKSQVAVQFFSKAAITISQTTSIYICDFSGALKRAAVL